MKKNREIEASSQATADQSFAMANSTDQKDQALIEIQDNRDSTSVQRNLNSEVNSHIKIERLSLLQRKINRVNRGSKESDQTSAVERTVVQRIAIKEINHGQLQDHANGRRLIAQTLFNAIPGGTDLDKKLIRQLVETDIDPDTKEYLFENIAGTDYLAEIQATVDSTRVGNSLPANRQRTLGPNNVIILKRQFDTILNLYQVKLNNLRTSRPGKVTKIMNDYIDDESLHGGLTLKDWETTINQRLLNEGQVELDDASEVQGTIKTKHTQHQTRYNAIQTEVGKLQTICDQSHLPNLPAVPQDVQTQKQLQTVVDDFKSHYKTLTDLTDAIDATAATRNSILSTWRNDVGAILSVTVTNNTGGATGGHSNLHNISWNKFGLIQAGTQTMPNTQHGLNGAITGNQRTIQGIQTELKFMIKKDTDALTLIQTTITGWSTL